MIQADNKLLRTRKIGYKPLFSKKDVPKKKEKDNYLFPKEKRGKYKKLKPSINELVEAKTHPEKHFFPLIEQAEKKLNNLIEKDRIKDRVKVMEIKIIIHNAKDVFFDRYLKPEKFYNAFLDLKKILK